MPHTVTPQKLARGHRDLRVHIAEHGNRILVRCECGNWERLLEDGHTLKELRELLRQHRQAEKEAIQAQMQKAELW